MHFLELLIGEAVVGKMSPTTFVHLGTWHSVFTNPFFSNDHPSLPPQQWLYEISSTSLGVHSLPRYRKFTSGLSSFSVWAYIYIYICGPACIGYTHTYRSLHIQTTPTHMWACIRRLHSYINTEGFLYTLHSYIPRPAYIGCTHTYMGLCT